MAEQQLVSMGFSDDIAAEALTATGGDIIKATEWILSHKGSQENSSNFNRISSSSGSPTAATHDHHPSPPPFQPKIDRFFQFQSKPLTPTSVKPIGVAIHEEEEEEDKEDEVPPLLRLTKRPKVLFESEQVKKLQKKRPPHEPLSERMRPRTLDDVVGQDHILAPKSLLPSAIDCGRLPSILLSGPPGTGKTSIARAIVNTCSGTEGGGSTYRFVSLSAVTSGVKDVRDAVDEARRMKKKGNKRTILFIDEVHRFNKAQQDSFLPVIEDGSVIFIGATTENPSFHLITPLLSRCRVLTLNPLKPHHIATLLRRAAADSDKGLSCFMGEMMKIEVNDECVEFLSTNCDGDARVALNALEISATTAAARMGMARGSKGELGDDKGNADESSLSAVISLNDVKEAMQCKHLAYDRAGDEHYNLISALHKSMRGSDANASIYWLARMLEGGEEPLYIARRLVRFASEDVGLADPSALGQAVACYQACHFIGMPECNVILAQCVAYLALAPKSIAVYRAIGAAQKVVRESVGQNEGVPLHLRNAPTKLMKDLGYGRDYIYTPDNPNSSQTYLPPSLQGYKFLDWPNVATNDR
ncbi:ATPase WRNIP1 [Capsicum galapagoense]